MKRIENRYTYCFIVVGIIFVFSVCMSYIYRVPVLSNGMPFFICLVMGLFLPGYAAVNLLKIKLETNVELMAYALFLGY